MRKPNSKRFLEESVDVLFTCHAPVFVEPLMECKEKIDLDEKLVVFLKVFVRISRVLYLTPAECQILLGLNTRNAKCWKYWVKKAEAGKSFSHDKRNKLERLANLVSIYKLSDTLYGDGTGCGTRLWDRNGDSPFLGFSPIEYMLRGHFAQLFNVRNYLEPKVRATYHVRPDDGAK